MYPLVLYSTLVRLGTEAVVIHQQNTGFFIQSNFGQKMKLGFDGFAYILYLLKLSLS